MQNEEELRTDFQDLHTVGSSTFFDENDFEMHKAGTDTSPTFWGEVKCYAAPENWYLISQMLKDVKTEKGENWKGYNYSYYTGFGEAIGKFFEEHAMNQTGSGIIKDAGDIATATGHGKMYMDGRNAQTIMARNTSDGFAINGWSSGNGLEGLSGWFSGMVDDGRNLAGEPEIYAYYTRPLQIAVSRKGGKFHKPGQEAQFRLNLINEGKLDAGNYNLKLYWKDNQGKVYDIEETIPVAVAGGDVFAQTINESYKVRVPEGIHGGYVTLQAVLLDRDGQKAADGMEQILVTNRASFASDLEGLVGAAFNWDAAKNALTDAGAALVDYAGALEEKLDYITAAGNPTNAQLEDMLKRVKKDGTTLLVKMDQNWADLLYKQGILSEKATVGTCVQNGYWNGNGFGYVDYFVGNTGLLDRKYTDTQGWEFGNGNSGQGLTGFAPFSSEYKTEVYGTHLARPNQINVLLGTVEYGKGKIVLAPSFPVDTASPMNDLLFYNMIAMTSGEKEPADYTEVEEVIVEAYRLVENQYTEESWKVLQDAIGQVEWNLPDQTVVDGYRDAIKDALANLERNSEEPKMQFDITVNGETNTYDYNEPVVVTAPDAGVGEKFAYWKAEGKIVSYDSTYRFYASKDMVFEAVYVTDTEEVMKEASAMLTNVFATKNVNPEKTDVRFVGELVIPEGYTVLEAGLVWSSKADKELVTDNKIGEGLNPTYIKKISDTNQFSVTIKGMPKDKFIRGVIFAKVDDGKGNIDYIFSDEKIAYAAQ